MHWNEAPNLAASITIRLQHVVGKVLTNKVFICLPAMRVSIEGVLYQYNVKYVVAPVLPTVEPMYLSRLKLEKMVRRSQTKCRR